jgi:GTPase
MLDEEQRADLEAELKRRDDAILVSALSGEGMEAFRRFVSDRLTAAHKIRLITLSLSEGSQLAWLRANGEIVSEAIDGDVMTLNVRLSETDFGRFQARS